MYAEDADGWYVPIMGCTLGDNRYWPANQIFRKLVGYKSTQSEVDSDWHAPKEFLCPSDLVSNQERPTRSGIPGRATDTI